MSRAGGKAVAGSVAAAPAGLLAKLVAAVRAEFRADVLYAQPSDPVLGGPVCRVGGCGRVARRRGLCSGHGLRWVGQGRPDLDTFVAVTDPHMRGEGPYPPCSVPGCGYAQQCQKLCQHHRSGWRRDGQPELARWLDSARAPVVGQPPPLCCAGSCQRWAEPRSSLCVTHAQRWRERGRPDLEQFSQDCLEHPSGREHVDLALLEAHLRLEMQYVLQQRYDHPEGQALLRPSLLQQVVRLLAGSGMASLLACSEDAWDDFLATSWRGTRTFLTYARAQVETLHHGAGWEVEYPRAVWRLRHLGISNTSGYATVSFADIPQPWLVELAKRWARWRFSCGLNPATVGKGVAAITHLAQFFASPQLNIAALVQINRAVLERYLAHLHASGKAWQRAHFISLIGIFFADIRRHHWDPTLPTDAVFFREDSPKTPQPLPRALAEHIMAQVEHPNNLQLFANPTYTLVTIILIRGGLRVSDATRLPFDCLLTDADTAPYLRYYNHKMKREALIPIDSELHQLIVSQQQRLLHRWPQGVPVLFPRAFTNREGRKPLSSATYRSALRSWLQRCDVRDELGQPVHLTPHQWRHTLGTRLINLDVPQHVVQKLFDHDSPRMTGHYAKLSDATVRQHWQRARKVNAQGQTVTLDPDGPLAEAAWAKQRLGRATQALPNGYCGLPLAQSCPHANACLACPMFLTTAEFLPQHRTQHQQTLQIISKAEAQGQTRMAEMNRQVATNLEKIITALDNDDDDPGQLAHAS